MQPGDKRISELENVFDPLQYLKGHFLKVLAGNYCKSPSLSLMERRLFPRLPPSLSLY